MSEQLQELPTREYTYEEHKIIQSIMDCIGGYHYDLNQMRKGIRDSAIDEKYSYTGHIMGKMLTIIDSTIEDKERREAAKSIVKQMINHEKEHFINDLYMRYKND